MFLFASVSSSLAQGDSTLYVNGIPVTGDDSIEVSPDVSPGKETGLVPVSEIPAKLLKTLRKEDAFKGWERAGVHFNRKTKRYTVTVLYSGGAKIFGLDSAGQVVTYDEGSGTRDR